LLSFFLSFILSYRTTEQGWATERWLRDRCAHEVADGGAVEMKLGLQEKMEQKVENLSNQQQ
jgi:hypothetical protein